MKSSDSGWNRVRFAGLWGSSDGLYFRKANGWVFLTGSIDAFDGTPGDIAFKLPRGFRPSLPVFQTLNGSTGNEQVTVLPSGDVAVIYSSGQLDISLSFPAEA